jgi:uncharacterized protein YdgA (DUF945 family)
MNFEVIIDSNFPKYKGEVMFGFLKPDPVKKLKKQYSQKLEQAMLAQRSGDLRLYAEITVEAEALLKEIKALDS